MRSPFTGLRFARLEFDNFRAGKMIKLAIVAISLIPLIYGGLFLAAFLDPYGNLVNVPAAVVNLDEGAEVNGEQRNVGQELCDSLVENNDNRIAGQASGYNWQFTDSASAGRGLEDATYYMELIIPKDFSANIASADSEAPKQSMLQVYFNPSTNLIAQTVGSSMVTKIKAELTNKIGEEYYKNIFVKIDEAADKLQDAVDGTNTLRDGLVQAKDGSQALSDGLSTLADGTSTLAASTAALPSSTEKLADGADSVSSGADQIASGASRLSQGTRQLQDQTSALPDQSARLSDGGHSLADGIDSANSGAQKLSSGASQVKEGIASLKAGISTLRDGGDDTQGLSDAAAGARKIADGLASAQTSLQALSAAAQGLSAYATALRQISTGIGQVAQADPAVQTQLLYLKSQLDLVISGDGTQANPGIDGIASALSSVDVSKLSEAQAGARQLADGLDRAVAAIGSDDSEDTGTVMGGVNALLSGSSTLEGGLDSLSSGLDSASSGAGKLAGSLDLLGQASNKLAAGVGTLNSGAGELADGASTLASGSATLAAGNRTLANSSGALVDGVAQLDSGASQLSSGSESLVVGLGDAVDGTQELSDGIADGQQQMKDNTKNSETKAAMMGTPVEANGESGTGESITSVGNYGTGFAPYFIGLGLWVGALMISFLIRSLNGRILMSAASSTSSVLASYIPMACIAVVQAMLLLLFVQFGLSMEIKYPLAFYLFGVVTALCFAAVIQFFRASLGTVGMVVIVVLLMLQLCTAAGTFPIETELPFFQALNPFLPMTYVVHGFRMAMAGLSLDYIWGDVAVLGAFALGFLFFTLLVARKKRRASMSTLYPPLKLAS